MRSLLLIAIASVVFGGTSLGGSAQRIEDLLTGIFQDVGAIANSFEGGPDDPHGPVTNAAARTQDQARLDAATDKAQRLAGELQQLYPPAPNGGR
jgi:hypothetical protein